VLDLRAHADVVPDAGTLLCKPYMGGEASILPGNLVPAGLEFFAPGDPATGGDFAPLTLARYPNRISPPKQWSGGTTEGYVITPDAATAARLPHWAQQLESDPASVFAHYLGGLEWDDAHHAVANISLPPPPGPPSPSCGGGAGNCSCFESGFDYDGNDLVSPVASPSQPACCALCAATPGCKFYSFCPNGACAGGPTMCYLKTSDAGRKPWPNRLSGPHAPSAPSPTLTLSPCPSHYNEPGFDALDDKGTCVSRLATGAARGAFCAPLTLPPPSPSSPSRYYTYNILAELDVEGEYYINRTAGLLYVWLPSGPASPFWATAPWSSPVVGAERAPVAATVTTRFFTSSMLDTLTVCQTAQTVLPFARLPIQANFVKSTPVSLGSSTDLGMRPRLNMPNWEPSLGACACR